MIFGKSKIVKLSEGILKIERAAKPLPLMVTSKRDYVPKSAKVTKNKTHLNIAKCKY